MENEKKYDIIIKKSVQKYGRIKTKTRANFSIKQKTIAKIAIAIIAISMLGKGVGNLVEKNKMNAALENHSSEVIAVVDDAQETSAYDIKNNHPSIDHSDIEIARYLVDNKENFDVKFYEVYKQITKESTYSDNEIRDIMNRILKRVSEMTIDTDEPINYASFADYVKKHNFLDSKGEASYKMYDRYMMGVIYQLQQASEKLDDAGFGGRS